MLLEKQFLLLTQFRIVFLVMHQASTNIAGFLCKMKQYLLAQKSADKTKYSQFTNETYDPIKSAGMRYC